MAIPIEPGSDRGAAEHALGLQFIAEGKLDEAVTAFKASIRADPGRAEFYANLGAALIERGATEEAATVLRVGIRLSPTLGVLHDNLSNALFRNAKYDEAIAAAREAVRLLPQEAGPHSGLAASLRSAGNVAGATVEYRQALRIDPTLSRAASALAYLANFDPRLDAEGVLAVASEWSQRFEVPILSKQQPHANSADPNRRLKIGYVSPNFHLHAESHFVLPLLEHHDHQQFEIHCFWIGKKRDAITERHRKCADGWHEIGAMSDEQAASGVRELGIDILIDLTMHMADNRMGIFCWKPAPVQAAWLAYPGTTGLRSMDYRITDAIIDRPGAPEWSTEKAVRLPTSWICYDPLSEATPCRANQRSFISFGSFNTTVKLSERSVRLWGRLLARVPNSKLGMIACADLEAAKLRRILGEMGVGPDRIGLAREGGREQYLRLYDQIDIALDTLPYNGVTTSLDSLWMNVPVVTLAGSRAQGRSGTSLLTVAGLTELIANSEEEFIEIAAELAKDANRLGEYHRTLRSRLERTPLMDGKAFAAEMEQAYRQMWLQWCAGKAPQV